MAHLLSVGWSILGRNVAVGRDEIDIVAVEPAPRGGVGTLVFVEVRSRSSERFGSAEESVDASKVRRLYRSALASVRAGELPDGRDLPPLPWRVDLVCVDRSVPSSGRVQKPVRELRPRCLGGARPPDPPGSARGTPRAVLRHVRGIAC